MAKRKLDQALKYEHSKIMRVTAVYQSGVSIVEKRLSDDSCVYYVKINVTPGSYIYILAVDQNCADSMAADFSKSIDQNGAVPK